MMAEDFAVIDGRIDGQPNVMIFIDCGATSRSFISKSTCDDLSLPDDALKPCNKQGFLADGSQWSSFFYLDTDVTLHGRFLGLPDKTFRTRLFVLHKFCRDVGVIIGQPGMVRHDLWAF